LRCDPRVLAKCAVVPALHAPHATHDRLHTLQSGGARTPLLLSPESPLPRRLTVVPHAHLHRIAQSQSSEPTTVASGMRTSFPRLAARLLLLRLLGGAGVPQDQYSIFSAVSAPNGAL